MEEARLVKTSKYLSKHLRHRPDRLGLTLAPGGWVEVSDLLAACAAHRLTITREELEEVVARNNKQRFAFDGTGTRIRANQGHSVEIDLQLQPVEPPDILYHGTSEQMVPIIRREGLNKMSRHHVHLSADVETARQVGARHGRPVILTVQARKMHQSGHLFYRSANGAWLTESVPAEYLGET
jgi:putative RNA 2'-phosphotransferase